MTQKKKQFAKIQFQVFKIQISYFFFYTFLHNINTDEINNSNISRSNSQLINTTKPHLKNTSILVLDEKIQIKLLKVKKKKLDDF